jgi:lipoprotein-anchoring transpeptidase ErfK/SrfK
MVPSIDISLTKRRLYLYQGNRIVKSYPIGIGKILTRTPIGTYMIINKVPYPNTWPGGPLTAFGTLWMGLSRPHYGIHGTNKPASIGKMVSKGCIRMYNRDVEDLGRRVSIGTYVHIHY